MMLTRHLRIYLTKQYFPMSAIKLDLINEQAGCKFLYHLLKPGVKQMLRNNAILVYKCTYRVLQELNISCLDITD